MAAPPVQYVPAVNPETGAVENIHPEDVGLAQQQGWRMPSPEEWAAFQKAEHFGSPGQRVATLAEGVGEGLLGPLGPGLEVAVGVPKEDILARKQENPVTSTVGQVGGFVLPAVATLGSSAAAQTGVKAAAKATLPELMSSAGSAAAKVAGKVAGEGALGRVVQAGARFGTEGAILGAANVGTEAILQDPNAPLTVEKAAAEIGFSAFAGGLLGTGGRTLLEVVPKGVAEKLAGWAGEVAGQRGVKAAGAIQSDINKSLKRMSRDDLNALGRRAVENEWVTPLSTPAETFAKTGEAMQEAGGKMGDLLERASAVEGSPRFDWKDIRQTIESEVLVPMREKAASLPAVKQAEGVLENFETVYGGKALSLKEIHGLRRDLDAIIYQHGRAIDPFAKAVAEPLKGARDVVSAGLEEGIERAGLNSAEWRALNAAYRDAKVINGFAEKGMLRAEGNNLLSLTETMSGLTGLATHGVSGGVLGAVGGAALRRHSSGTLAWALTGAQKALLRMAEGGESKIASGLGRLFGEGSVKAASEATEHALTPRNYSKIASELKDKAGDITRLADSASQQTRDLHEHAPEHGVAADSVIARGTQHLASKLPQEPELGPFGGTYKPSPAELAPFNRAAKIAQNPASILDDIRRGTIHPDHVEALATIYPAIHKEMTVQIMDRLAAAGATGQRIPFKVRMGLALFLGGNMDPMLQPAAMLANQAALTVASKNEQTGNVEPSSRSLDALGVAGRMSTPMQASAYRSA